MHAGRCRLARGCAWGLAVLLLGGCASSQPSTIVDFGGAGSRQAIPGDAPAPLVAAGTGETENGARQRPGRARPYHPVLPPEQHSRREGRPRATTRREKASRLALPRRGVPKEWVYRVQPGDRLEEVARRFGEAPQALATRNNLSPPYVLYVNQSLHLEGVRPVRRESAPAEVAPLHGPTPSEKAGQSGGARRESDRGTASADPRTLTTHMLERDGIAWSWPAAGKVVSHFNDHSAKGVDIAAPMGTPVYAAAAGQVVYSGSGLRGYGQLIIIKHSKIYLSAYAHNHRLLVKEGQAVRRGQKIAEIGSSDADQTKLHFEIRRLGKPVDPMRFLPNDKPI